MKRIGNIQMPGSMSGARGAITADGIYLRCDHNDMTVTQIGAHELYHYYARENPGLNERLKEKIIQKFTAEEYNRVAQIYLQKLGRVNGITENMDTEAWERAVAKIEEEIFADAFGNMNAFGAGADRFTETVRSEVNGTVGTENAAATEKMTGPPAQFSEDEKEYMKPFAEQLRDFMDKENRRTIFGKDALLIGETPKIFRDIGLTLPVAINQTHVSYAIDEAYEGPEKYKAGHTFTIEEFSKLPEKLADPVAIIPDPSKNDLIVYVDMENASGEQTIVPFRMNTRTFLGNQKIDVQLAKSVFGAEDAENVLIRAIEKDSEDDIRVYYVNRGKIPSGIDSAVRKHGGHVPDGIIHSINDAGSPVKPTIRSQTETSQFKRWFAGTKVVNADGTPKTMYRGDPEEVRIFDRKKSKSSNLYGRGFYFTDSQSHAGTYGEARPYYLSVKTPLSPGQKSITQGQMRAFLEAVAENEDDFSFENYGQNATVDSVLRNIYGKGDFEMLQDVNATAIGDLVAAVELFNEVNGTKYDGIILPTETVIFQSGQAKHATENIGTYDRNNPDTHFSEDDDISQSAAEYAQQRNRVPESSAEYARMRQRELLEEKELQRLENKARTSAEARRALAEARRYNKEKEKPRKREMRIRGYGGEVGI